MKSIGTGEHQVVCLHGWFGSGDGWGFWPAVADTEAFTWHFPEMRGYGERRSETGEYTMKEYAADALTALDDAGVERFSILGHSMGGKAAASLLAQAGEDRVRALIGVSPVAPAPVPLDDDGKALFFGAPESDDNRRGIIDFTTGNRNSSRWVEDMVAFSREASTVEAFKGAVDSWVGDDYLAEVGRPATPILCLVGETDPALSADVMEQSWRQIYPNVEVEVLASAGHYAMFESPVWMATRVEAFLADR